MWQEYKSVEIILSLQKFSTVAVDKVGQVKVQFSDGDVDVIGIDAEARMEAIGRLFQPLAVRTLQRNGFEQDDHHQIQPPNLFISNLKWILLFQFKKKKNE